MQKPLKKHENKTHQKSHVLCTLYCRDLILYHYFLYQQKSSVVGKHKKLEIKIGYSI